MSYADYIKLGINHHLHWSRAVRYFAATYWIMWFLIVSEPATVALLVLSVVLLACSPMIRLWIRGRCRSEFRRALTSATGCL